MDFKAMEIEIKQTRKCPICASNVVGHKINVGSSSYPVVHKFVYCSSCSGYLLACYTCDAFHVTEILEENCPQCGPQEILNSMYTIL